MTYPDDTPTVETDNPSVKYLYEDARHPAALTGIVNQLNVRARTWTYDDKGRATSSQHTNGVDRTDIAYDDTNNQRTVTNALGHSAVYITVASADGRLLSRIEGQASANCAADERLSEFDANGFLSASVDADGDRTTYINDAKGRVTSVTKGAGSLSASTTSFEWDSIRPLVKKIQKPGLTTSYIYDSAGRVTSITQVDTTINTAPYSTNGQSRTWNYTYNSSGLLVSIDGPLAGTADTIHYTYDAGGYLHTVENEVGHITTFTSVDAAGRVLESVNASGLKKNYQYDQTGRLISVIESPDSSPRTMTVEYDVVGNVKKFTLPNGVLQLYYYDDSNHLTSIEDGFGNRLELTRNAMGGITSSTLRGLGGSIAEAASQTFDELNRVLAEIGANGQSRQFVYSSEGAKVATIDEGNNLFSQSFDPLKRLVQESGPLQHSVTRIYGSGHELRSVSDARNVVTNYDYNGFGDIIRITSADAGSTVYTYDSRGLLSTATSPSRLVKNSNPLI